MLTDGRTYGRTDTGHTLRGLVKVLLGYLDNDNFFKTFEKHRIEWILRAGRQTGRQDERTDITEVVVA